MIFTALSPNTKKDDFQLVIRSLFKRNKYLEGESVEKLKEWFRDFFDVGYVSAYESGRTGLFNLLKELDVGTSHEVILQSFTCVAAVNPVKWTGATPVFTDINPHTFNMDFDDLVNKTTSKTKVIILQHTFGYPNETEKIVDHAKENNIVLIEDCAHTIGGETDKRKLGTFGDAAVFSLGRDKAISGSFGGVVITKNAKLGRKLVQAEEVLKFPSKTWVFQQLLYTAISYLTRKYYRKLFLGKGIHFVSTKLNLINKATTKDEKQEGSIPSFAGSVLPDVFAKAALNQLAKINKFNKRRNEQTKFYAEKLERLKGAVILPKWKVEKGVCPVRFPVLAKNREELVKYAQKKGLILGNWYDVPVAPNEVVLHKTGYKWGSCPNTEQVCREVVNLPLNIEERDLQKVVKIINSFYSLGSVD